MELLGPAIAVELGLQAMDAIAAVNLCTPPFRVLCCAGQGRQAAPACHAALATHLQLLCICLPGQPRPQQDELYASAWRPGT